MDTSTLELQEGSVLSKPAAYLLLRLLVHHAGVQKKLGLKGVGGFAVSQNAGAIHLAAYVPEGKGAPGFVGVWPLGQLSKAESPPPVARRSFFRVHKPFTFSVSPGHALLKLRNSALWTAFISRNSHLCMKCEICSEAA